MSDTLYPTAVVVLHPTADDQLQSWLDRATSSARALPGFRSLRLTHADGGLQTAVAATFDTVEQLNAWLDSDALSAADGVLRKWSDLVIADGHRLPPGTEVFRHDVIHGRQEEFVDAQEQMVASTAGFPGYLGTVLVPAAPDDEIRHWFTVLAFRTDDQLATWLSSEERARNLPELRAPLTRDFDQLSVDAPFGSIVRIDHGRARVTPNWKTAMLVLMVLYPTVMLLSRFVGPVLVDLGIPTWLELWLSQIVSVALLSYALMPWATRAFTRWLDPVDGAGARVSLAGAAIVVIVYAVTLTLFASVRWLQFWSHG